MTKQALNASNLHLGSTYGLQKNDAVCVDNILSIPENEASFSKFGKISVGSSSFQHRQET